jgi:branched-chain amino acid transport system permease protein
MEYYVLLIATSLAINSIFALSLNLQFGLTGVLNFGYIVFVAVGAYITSVTTLGHGAPGFLQTYIVRWDLPWPLPLLAGGLASAALAALVAVVALKDLRSDYQAIAMIAVAQVLWIIVGNRTSLFNGYQGLAGIPRPFGDALASSSPLTNDLVFLGICLVFLAGCLFLCRRIYRSPLGRIMRAIKDDEVVPESFGRGSLRVRFTAFVLGSFIAGVGGGLLVEHDSAFGSNGWVPIETFIIFAAVIIGGMGNNLGSILGAAVVLVGLNEATRFLPSSIPAATVQPLRGILIGALMLLVLRFRPQGLIPERRNRLYESRLNRPVPQAATPALSK